MRHSGYETVLAFCYDIQFAFSVGAEIQKRYQKSAREEEGVDAEGPVRDGLEEEVPLDHFSVLHVV